MSEEKERIIEFIKTQIAAYGFGGAVVGISGGIDSAVVGKLLTEALGKHNVFGLLLPERDSSKTTIADSVMVCEFLGIHYSVRNITPLVRQNWAVYRDEAARVSFPKGTYRRGMPGPSG